MRLCIPILFILAFTTAQAAGDVRQANDLFGKMRYVKALQVAERALEDPNNGPLDLVAGYRILGLCQAALGKTKKALDTFRKLLAIDPSFRFSREISPKLAAPFYQAVAMVQGGDHIALAHQPPESPASLQGLHLEAKLQANPFGMVEAIRFRFRLDTEEKERMIVNKIGDPSPLEAKILLPAGLKAYKISYFFEAANEFGGTLARAGSYNQPFHLQAKLTPKPLIAPVPPVVKKKKPLPKIVLPVKTPEPIVPPPPKRPEVKDDKENGQAAAWYQTWWFWTAVGVVVAGAATGVVLATTGGEVGGVVDYKIRVKYSE